MKTIDETYVEKLLEELTLDEKVNMIHSAGLFRTEGVERLGIPPLVFSDGPMGVRNEFDNDKWLPIGKTDDYVTYLPCNSALAATWNRKLAYNTGLTLGTEARGRGKDVILAPGVNIKKVPLCGRNFEYMSEDPFLNSELAVDMIKGIQKNDVAACVKHFAVNNQETDRLSIDTDVDERALNEIYFPAFKAAIEKGNSYSIMGAYNKIFGVHCCHSKYLLNEVLREKWNYDGLIVSDWGGVHETNEAAKSALDVEMSIYDNFEEYFFASPLKEAIKNGEIDEELVNEKVRNVLRLMLRLKMIGKEKEERKQGYYNAPENRQSALETAKESIILLKNEDNNLPIRKNSDGKKVKSVAVIGQNAITLHSNRGGSAEIKSLYEITPLMGIKILLGGNCKVKFSEGYYVPKELQSTENNWQEFSLMVDDEKNGVVREKEENVVSEEEKKKVEERRKKYLEDAIKIAKECDKVIFVGGLDHNLDVEGQDREDMKLPYAQDKVIKELLKVRKDMTIVMMAGAAVDMSEWIDEAKSVVWMYYAGMEGGNALASVLFGKISPSGKLPETMAKKLDDYYAIKLKQFGKFVTKNKEKVTYEDGIYVGYRYFDTFNIEPQFCFGHGLSYTTFEYSNINATVDKNGEVIVSLDLKNVGTYEAAEIVQVYVSSINSEVKRPKKELKEFTKVYLKQNETKNIVIKLSKEAFSYYFEKDKKFVTKAGKYTISVGASSRDIKKKIEVEII